MTKHTSPVVGAAPAAAASKYSYAVPNAEVTSPFSLKLPFFGVLFLLFSFSLYAYSRIGLDSYAIFRVVNYQATYAKLLSPMMALFIALVSLSIALAVFCGKELEIAQAAGMGFAAAVLPAVLMGLFFSPDYLYPFIAFSSAVFFAGIFGSRLSNEERSLSGAYNTVSRALLGFLIVSLVLSLAAGYQQRDKYFDQLFAGLAETAPAVMTGGAGVVANLVDNYQIDRATIEQMFPREKVAQQLAATVPSFSSLPQATKDMLVQQSYDSILVPQITGMKNGLAQSLREYASKPPKELTSAEIASLKAQVATSDSYKQLYAYFPFAIPLLVLSFLSLAKIPVQLLATVFAYAALKVL